MRLLLTGGTGFLGGAIVAQARAARTGDAITLAAAGVANIPRSLDRADPLAGLPGHPQSAWKRTVLTTLVERATVALRA